MAFEILEPFSGARGDDHAALIASTVANVNRKEGRRAYTLTDFRIDYEDAALKAAGRTPTNQVWAKWEGLAAALGLSGKRGEA